MEIKGIIAIDVDSTVANLDDVWRGRYNRDYNDNMTIEDIKSWDTHLYVKPECGLKIYDYLEDPTLYDEILPIPYALEAVNYFKSLYYRIIFVTSSTLGASGAKYKWLIRYNFLDNMNDYVECRDKSLILADLMIDDRPENLFRFHGKGILYSQPWNRKSAWKGFVIDSWETFLKERKMA